MLKNILCFGDSNTYGFIAGSGDRYNENERWTKLLQKHLGEDYYVIEEGMNARTTVFDDPDNRFLNGSNYLEMIVATHRPLDLVIIMLGTNDLKEKYRAGVTEIAKGIEALIQLLRDSTDYRKEILIVAPIHISEKIVESGYSMDFGGITSVDKSKSLASEYEKVARENQCHFLDAAKYATTDDTDAIHLDKAGHAALAKALYNKIKNIEEGLGA